MTGGPLKAAWNVTDPAARSGTDSTYPGYHRDEVKAAAYRRMVEEAGAGRLRVEVETYPLERVREMWEAQAAFPRHKLVLRPGSGG